MLSWGYSQVYPLKCVKMNALCPSEMSNGVAGVGTDRIAFGNSCVSTDGGAKSCILRSQIRIPKKGYLKKNTIPNEGGETGNTEIEGNISISQILETRCSHERNPLRDTTGGPEYPAEETMKQPELHTRSGEDPTACTWLHVGKYGPLLWGA